MKEIDNVDLIEASKISERIVKKQPFIMSLLIGYKFDVKEEQLNEIMKMLFIIFLFFEKQTKIDKYQINPIDFESHQKKNIKFLKYFSTEPNKETQVKSNELYLSNLRFKSLFTGILMMSNTSVNFRTLSPELRGIIIIGMKTLIDCLETNLLENKM